LIPDVARHGGTDQVAGLINVAEIAEPAFQGLQKDIENIGKDVVTSGGQENVGDPVG
jgi:hypothetical protein